MNIGILAHSSTGHTLAVAQMLQEKLIQKGHTASIAQVRAANDGEPDAKDIVLTYMPAVGGFEMVIFAAPVRGLILSPVMQAVLMDLPDLSGKLVAGYVTQLSPKPSLGGRQALACMESLCQKKGASLAAGGVIGWLNPYKREKRIIRAMKGILDLV